MRFGTILFDLDGTLNDSGEGIMRSAAYAAERMGRPVPDDDVLREFIGPPLIRSFQTYCGMTEDEARRATELFRERFSDIGWRENRVYPGIAPLLRALKRGGAYVAVASAKPQIFIERIAAYFGFDRYLDRVVGITAENTRMDKIEQIRSALPMGINPADAVIVGDRRFDIESGRTVGLHTIGAGYGYGTRAELEAAGADEIADTVSALTDLLLDPDEREKGMFITFEGADGCGKSTQMRLAAEYLTERGYDVIATREPGGCPIAEEIRNVVLGVKNMGMTDECEALLFAAARTEHVKNVILPGIADGKIVLCDRFLDSSFAYQARGRELGDDFIRQINAYAYRATPDRTLLFVGDRETISERLREHTAEPDRIESESDAFVRRVYAGYAEIAAAEPDRVHKIESTRGIEAVFADVRAELDDLLR